MRGRLTTQLSVIQLVAWGVLYFSFSVFLPAMEDEFGWSSTVLAGGFSVALLISGLAAPSVGRWIDERGPRGLMTLAAIGGTLGVVAWSYSASLPAYFFAWAVIGLAMAGILYPPAFAAIVRANPENARRAILIVTLIGALASTVFWPLAGLLDSLVGWRSALRILAVVLAMIVVPLAVLLPSGRVPPGQPAAREAQPAPSARPGGFARLSIGLMVVDAVGVALTAYLVVFLVEQGMTLQFAAVIAGLGGMAKLGGRLFLALARHTSAFNLLRASIVIQAGAIVAPLFWPTSEAAVTMVLGYGAMTGARTVLRPALLVERYGPSGFGRRNGLLQLYTTLAKSAGPLAMGFAVAVLGWSWAWAGLALLLMFGAALLSLERGPTPLPSAR